MTNVTIKTANRADSKLLVQLGLQTFCEAFEKDNNPEDFKTYVDEAFSEAQIIRDLEEYGSVFFIACIDQQPAGYARLRLSTEVNNTFPDKKLIELHRLYVLNRHIGSGIGKVLIEHCLTFARAQGYNILWLGVWEHNHRAQAFYQKFGFGKFSSHVFMVGNDAQTDFLLKKDL